MIVVVPPAICTSTTGKATDYNSSRSNRTTSAMFPSDPGVGFQESSLDVSIYPNPSNGVFRIKTNGITNYSLRVYDISGRLLINDQVNGFNHILDLNSFESGSYVIKIESEQTIYSTQVIKN
jgi:hypothetical protein